MQKYLKIFLSSIFTTIILLGFAMPLNPVGNWYQQFLPNLPNFQVSDMYFLDSTTGFIVTGNGSPNDSSGYILKTTNSGDNWVLKFAEFRDFSRVKFINSNTGFVSGGYFNGARIYKTTNAGENWFGLNIPGGGQIYFDDMSVWNEDTIWVVASNSLVGGVFFTSNGGSSWAPQGNFASSNPSHIYMYNARIGFIDGLKKTTNGGQNWNPIAGGEPSLFFDMHFTDSLTGWKCHQQMRKTTNGGLNWINQTLPTGGNIVFNYMLRFSNINKDTIWGTGGVINYGGPQSRGMLFRTTDGGNNWLYQIPDTSINIFQYFDIQFINRRIGWAYSTGPGIHTVLGGDTGFITGIRQISANIPTDYKLYQNYPNPFNPVTNIKYQIVNNKSLVKLQVFDITGKEVIILVDQQQSAGTYQVDFSGKYLASGIYFYILTVNGRQVDTKKMILLK